MIEKGRRSPIGMLVAPRHSRRMSRQAREQMTALLACIIIPMLLSRSAIVGVSLAQEAIADSVFDYREHGQNTAAFDWGGQSITADPWGAKRLDLVKKRAHIWIESPWRPDDYLLDPASPIITLNNENVSYLKYPGGASVARDSAETTESAFLHTTDPACMVAFCVPGGIELHWQPDRRIDYTTYGGSAVVPEYKLYRQVGTAPDSTEVYSIGGSGSPQGPVIADQHMTFTDPVSGSLTYTYKLFSIHNGRKLKYSLVTITNSTPATIGEHFWVEQVTAHVLIGVNAITYDAGPLLRLGAKYEGGQARSVRARIKYPSHELGVANDDTTVTLAAQYNGNNSWLYTYDLPLTNSARRHRFSSSLYGGFAVAFECLVSSAWQPLFGPECYTTNPNNRLRVRSFPEYIMNRESTAWQEAWLADAQSLLAQVVVGGTCSYSGIFGDSADHSLGWQSIVMPVEQTQAQYEASLNTMLTATGQFMSSLGKKLMINGISDDWYNDDESWDDHIDGVLQEGFTVLPGMDWTTIYLGLEWTHQLNRVQSAASRLSAASKPVIALAMADVDSVEARLFALASYCLVSQDNTIMCARQVAYEDNLPGTRADKSVAYFPEFQIDLGAATSGQVTFPSACLGPSIGECDGYLANNPLLTRTFENGMVVVHYRDFLDWAMPGSVYEMKLAANMVYRQGTSFNYDIGERKYLLQTDGKTLLEGGRIWTAPVEGYTTLLGRQSLILMNDPVASPKVDEAALYPLFAVPGASSMLAVHAAHWNGHRLWVEIDGSALGLGASIVLSDDGAGNDMTADDGIYTSTFLNVTGEAGIKYLLPCYARGDDGIGAYSSVGVLVASTPYAGLAAAPAVSNDYGLNYTGHPYSSATFDYNDDGKDDLMVTVRDGGSQMYRRTNPAAEAIPMYQDATYSVMPDVAGQGQGYRGVSCADLNNDGHSDVFLAHRSAPKLYVNNGGPGGVFQFTDMGPSVSNFGTLASDSWCGSWGDYDADGLVDLFIGRAQTKAGQGSNALADIGDAVPCVLLHGGIFTDVSSALGTVQSRLLRCVSATWGDVNDDGKLDLFAGQTGADEPPPRKPDPRVFQEMQAMPAEEASRLFVQGADGNFVNEWSSRTGGAAPDRLSSTKWVDVDNDGQEDLVAAGIGGAYLLLNNGGEYSAGFLPYWHAARGITTFDFDLDGRQDIMALPDTLEANPVMALYWNKDFTGYMVFADVAPFMGIDDYGTDGIDGATVMDFNRDGDLDLYLGKLRASKQCLLQNKRTEDDFDSPANHWVGIDLKGGGAGDNLAAIGAKVSVEVYDEIRMQRVDGGSGRGGQAPHTLIFGLGAYSGSTVAANIGWPNGSQQAVALTVGQVTEVVDASVDPQIDPLSLHASNEPYPGGGTTWIFSWKTRYPTVKSLDKVKIKSTYDAPNEEPSDCQIGQEYTWLYEGVPGVSVTVQACDGWYCHELRWERACAGMCEYWYKVYSSSLVQEVLSPSDDVFKRIRISTCIGD